MEWRDRGIVLASWAHGETSVILELLTRAHGRHLGLVRGGRSRRLRTALQTGNSLDVVWRARLAEHLGVWQAEALETRAAALMAAELPLTAARAAASLCRVLPERDACARMHDGLEELLAALVRGDAGWPVRFLLWEMDLLREMGYGPEPGNGDIAVNATVGECGVAGIQGRRRGSDGSGGLGEEFRRNEVVAGLRQSAALLERHGFADGGGGLPAARIRLGELLERNFG